MGNFASCICISSILGHTQNRRLAQDTIISGLLGPNGTRIKVEGMYMDLHTVEVYPEGLLEVSFYSNLSGCPTMVKRCLKLSDFGEYEGWGDDLLYLLSQNYKARMHIEKDRGYLYIGSISIVKDGTVIEPSVPEIISDQSIIENNIDREIITPDLPVENIQVNLEDEKYGICDQELILKLHETSDINIKEEKSQDVSDSLPTSEQATLNIITPSDIREIPQIKDENSLELSKSIDKVTFIDDQFS